MNWYAIQKTINPLFTEDTLVQAKNSKKALEKTINKKVKRVVRNYQPFDYSVRISDELGRSSRDRRTTVYYNVIG